MAFMNLNGLPMNDRGEVWSGDQMVGMMPGGGGGVSRDQIAQAMLAQQGMPPPQGPGPAYGGELGGGGGTGPRIDFGGLNPTPQGGGGGGRQQVGGGWSIEGNNVYDPGGNLVGSQGLQQYGYIPGVSPQGARAGLGLDNPYTGGSSLSGGRASSAGSGELGPLGANNAVGQVNPFSEGAATGRFSEGAFSGNMFGNSSGNQAGNVGALTAGALAASAQGRGNSGYNPDFSQANPNADIAVTASTGYPGGPFAGRGGKEGEGFGTFAQTGVVPGAAVNALGQIIDAGKAYAGGIWDSMTGQPLNSAAIQTGPNPNAPGNVGQAGTTGNTAGYGAPGQPGGPTGWSGDFGGFSPGAGGWGGSGDFGGFSGSGFNSSGSYSGGYDTAAGNVG